MKRAFRYIKISYFILITLMFIAWLVRYSMLGGNKINPRIERAIVAFAQFPGAVYKFFKPGTFLDKRYIPNTVAKSGLIYYVDTAQISPGYLLIPTFRADKDLEIKLLDTRKNKLIKTWVISPDTILRYANNNELAARDIRLYDPVLLKDSSLIFNTHYSLIKVNKNSKVLWCNRNTFHHSIEYASDTSVWACSTIKKNAPVFVVSRKDTLINDAIALVNSTNGKIIYQKSIHDILNDNGYKYLMAIGNFDNDTFHLNEINPATTDTKYWQKGDVLISIRHRSTVFLYRPSTNKILWLKTGPWANQHNCTFVGESKIMLLGNDVIRSDPYVRLLYHHNNIYTYDFATNTVDTPYYRVLDKLKPKTYTEGRCNILPNGDVLFDETNQGMVYVFDRDKLKMTYCDRIDKGHIKMLNLVRYIAQ